MKSDFVVLVLKPAAGFGLGLQILVGALAPLVGVDAGDRLAFVGCGAFFLAMAVAWRLPRGA